MTELPIDENTPRILIVEDEPKLGQLLIDYLRAATHSVWNALGALRRWPR